MMKIIEEITVNINKKRLEKRITQSSKKSQEWLDKVIKKCLKKCEPKPKAVYSFFNCKIDTKKNVIQVEDQTFNSKFMTERFEYAKEVGLFVITIGLDLEERSRKAFKKNDGVKGLVYDAIGSEYAESTANALHKMLEKEKGYCMSRFSPGYNDWNITEQSKLFNLVSGEKIGVSLNESCLMIPEKSVSAMIGYSDKEQESCKTCSKTDCTYRNLMK